MTPRDRFVALLVEQLPELRKQPEWRTDAADLVEMSLSSFNHGVFGPYLSRLIDASDQERLPRALEVVEELASHTEIEHEVVFLCEWNIFRRKYVGATLAVDLMGPKTRAIIDALQAAWEPWEPLVEVLFPFFHKVIERVQTEYPGLHGGSTAVVRTGGTIFYAYAGFIYDGASQRYEDMLLMFTVTADGVTYEIERGSGHPLVPRLDPASLPAEGSPEYFPVLLDYAEAAIRFTWENLPAILPQLREPYDVED